MPVPKKFHSTRGLFWENGKNAYPKSILEQKALEGMIDVWFVWGVSPQATEGDPNIGHMGLGV